ncbi:2-phosphosulfolactate phosphatase [Microbacterium sp. STN6]|uniref:2-phosphosulfolactate phosphatase n=1 Tax=Microbacterium sp. STN6 TaxID=2995588 RepID=UPI002260FB4F|nr:2-phosphosulfolactate phosphatase [Microbacterium sp. STN6]MCX7523159.1 2-phosphosulfolactate phosphatase [Microbacterium sp. STN6]
MKELLAPDTPTQTKYEVRFDWGREGLASISPGAGVIVVIDTISFTTTVGLAVEHGLQVVPFASTDRATAADAAGRIDAVLAGPRGGDGLTLSPSSITPENVAAIAPVTRLVVSSVNGSRLSAAAADLGVPVLAASLRNRTAVAEWILAQQVQTGDRLRVAIVAAGEERSDGTTRFAVEDLLAAGAIIDALAAVGIDYSSPEAAAACAAFVGLRRATGHLLTASVTGQQLIDAGARADVELAGAIDASSVVPVLGESGFVA